MWQPHYDFALERRVLLEAGRLPSPAAPADSEQKAINSNVAQQPSSDAASSKAEAPKKTYDEEALRKDVEAAKIKVEAARKAMVQAVASDKPQALSPAKQEEKKVLLSPLLVLGRWEWDDVGLVGRSLTILNLSKACLLQIRGISLPRSNRRS